MLFELTDEHIDIQKSIRQFMVSEVEPLVEQIDREDAFPPGIWRRLGDLGVLGVTVDEEYGGSGCDQLSAVLVVEQIARICPALGLSFCAHANLCADNLNRSANHEQKTKYLPGLCSGESIGSMALTEPDAGSDAVSIRTKAEKNGDRYILNGSKTFITNAPVADVILTYAKTDPAKHSRGITAFIVEKGYPGYSVPKKLEKIGNHGSETGEIAFEDCPVPVENVVGEVDGGVRIMMTGLDVERAVVGGLPLGLAQGALETALQYSKERVQFGRPICDFQMIKAKLADMYTEVEAARGLVYRAASLADQIQRGGRGTEIHKIAAAGILFAAEAASRVVYQAVQIHGGYGYMNEYPISRFFRDAKLYEIGAGTSEIRRLVIADELIARGL